ncbi:MFS transporter [Acidobacteriota bacterium]
MKKNILFSASLIHALNDASTVTVPMIFPLLYSQQYIITKYSHIGILSNVGLFVTFLFQILVAKSDHRFEYKNMLILSTTGIALTLYSITLASNFLSLLLIYLLMRFFVSFYHPIGISWVARSYSNHKLDFAMGIQSGSGNLGVLVAFITVGMIAQKYSWKTPLLIWSVLCFCLGIIAYSGILHTRTKVTTGKNLSGHKSWLQALIQIKFFVPGFIYGGACWGITIFYAPSLFNHKFEISLGYTGAVLGSWIFLGTIVTYMFGFLSHRLGRRTLCLIGFIGSTCALIPLGISKNSLLALISLFIFGAFLFLIYPAYQSYVGEMSTKQNKTLAFSSVANIQMLAGSLAGLIAGFLSDSFGINSPFLFLAGLGIIVSAYFCFIRKRL